MDARKEAELDPYGNKDHYLYLAARDRLPHDLKPKTPDEVELLRMKLAPDNGQGLNNVPNLGHVNSSNITPEEFEIIQQYRRDREMGGPTPKIVPAGQTEVTSSYAGLSKDQLIAEIDTRNSDGRADERKIDINGPKAELIQRLEADDSTNE